MKQANFCIEYLTYVFKFKVTINSFLIPRTRTIYFSSLNLGKILSTYPVSYEAGDNKYMDVILKVKTKKYPSNGKTTVERLNFSESYQDLHEIKNYFQSGWESNI